MTNITKMDAFSPSAPVRERLVQAADAALRSGGLEALTVESVAHAAGVSRATAFRQLGKREDMIVAVGLVRSAEYARTCAAAMAREHSVVDQICAAFYLLVRELPDDPVMCALMAVRSAAGLADDVRDLAATTFGPIVERGRRDGQIRDDVGTDQVTHWIVEQLYLAIEQPDRSADAVRDRLRLFVFPALAPASVASVELLALRAQADALSSALSDAVRASAALHETLSG